MRWCDLTRRDRIMIFPFLVLILTSHVFECAVNPSASPSVELNHRQTSIYFVLYSTWCWRWRLCTGWSLFSNFILPVTKGREVWAWSLRTEATPLCEWVNQVVVSLIQELRLKEYQSPLGLVGTDVSTWLALNTTVESSMLYKKILALC